MGREDKHKKFALIHQGNDESYGMVFVAGEINKGGHNIKWFDGESKDVVSQILDYNPDFICFSPLTTFFEDAIRISDLVKEKEPHIISVFGGVHVTLFNDVIKLKSIDIIVIGSVLNTIEKIIKSKGKEVIFGQDFDITKLVPRREEYYRDIPRIAQRERKYIMSHFGCVYNCSYCSTSGIREKYGFESYKKQCLTRRPIEDLIREAKDFLKFNTNEVSLEDDDILMMADGDIETWLEEFCKKWKEEINLPTYANVTPLTVTRVSDKTLEILSKLVSSVQMGVQGVTPKCLEIFNRKAHNKEIVREAYNRLKAFGIKIKMELIFGLPVEDPVSDAIESIKFAQELDAKFVGTFPLMLYPSTELTKWCMEKGIELNKGCKYEWHTGIGSINFGETVNRRIINLTKLGNFFVKYKIDERWMRALIDVDLNSLSKRKISETIYLESLKFRIGEEIEKDFDNIIKNMDFKF